MQLSKMTFAVALGLVLGGCASATSSSSSSSGTPMLVGMAPAIIAPTPDPRVGLRAGLQDAAQAIWNMDMVSHVQSPENFAGITNSDLAFAGANVIQGNYNGFSIWDIANPARPALRIASLCPASQSDVSVYKNLLFVSAEAPTARLDCGTTAPREPVSKDRIRGVRIFDITDISKPKYIANVQTCRGSHTHTVVTDPSDAANVYIYISGTSGVRPAEELAGCVADANDPNTSQFNIEVIRVPLANPASAAVVSAPRIFADMKSGRAAGLAYPSSHGAPPLPPYATKSDSNNYHFAAERTKLKPLTAKSTSSDSLKYNTALSDLRTKWSQPAPGAGRQGGGGGRAGGNGGPRMITQCHDITVYPAIGLAGGACAGMGLLLDIKDVAHPRRIDAVADSNFSFWHSATFSNDGSKVLFSDEWGGGGQAYCRVSDPRTWGADAMFSIVNGKMQFKGYYKLPAPQTQLENCVAHNGSLVPVPGRDIMVQAWYQGGISVFDWSDMTHPVEIAFFDRGPNDATRAVSGGFWSAYWYNGMIIGSEEKRGMDIFELKPSAALSVNELAAAKLVKWDHLNTQSQPHIDWPADISVVRSYLDQLVRGNGISAARSTAIDAALTSAMSQAMSGRMAALNALASQLDKDAGSARDGSRVRMMAMEVRRLANAGM